MERSNQPPEPECCRREGEASAAQAGVAPRLSNPASKPTNAGEDAVLPAELKTARAATGKALADLPGSKSVAHEEGTVRNQGDPVISRRTNNEDQAGRNVQRQEGRTEGKPGVGSLHSSAGQPRQSGADVREGGDRTTQPAQATSAV